MQLCVPHTISPQPSHTRDSSGSRRDVLPQVPVQPAGRVLQPPVIPRRLPSKPLAAVKQLLACALPAGGPTGLPPSHMTRPWLQQHRNCVAPESVEGADVLGAQPEYVPTTVPAGKTTATSSRAALWCCSCCMSPQTEQHAPWDSTAGGGASPSFESRCKFLSGVGLLAKALTLACCPDGMPVEVPQPGPGVRFQPRLVTAHDLHS